MAMILSVKLKLHEKVVNKADIDYI